MYFDYSVTVSRGRLNTKMSYQNKIPIIRIRLSHDRHDRLIFKMVIYIWEDDLYIDKLRSPAPGHSGQASQHLALMMCYGESNVVCMH